MQIKYEYALGAITLLQSLLKSLSISLSVYVTTQESLNKFSCNSILNDFQVPVKSLQFSLRSANLTTAFCEAQIVCPVYLFNKPYCFQGN